MAANQALWADVKRDLEAAKQSLLLAAERAETLKSRGNKMKPDVRFDRELAVGKLLHDCYGAMEAAMQRLVDAIDGGRPTGEDYHAQLIVRAGSVIPDLRPAMISKATAKDLQALRGFRHAVRHAYGEFDYDRAAPNVPIARRAVASFQKDITAFAKALKILPQRYVEER